MEHFKNLVTTWKLVRKFFTSFSTRQKLLSLILALVLIQMFLLTFVTTLMFMSGAVLGIWCALKLKNKPAVLSWDSVISLLPRISIERPLYVNGFGPEIQTTDIRTILQRETEEYVHLLFRDFVAQWYRMMSEHDEFSLNIFALFRDVVKKAKRRVAKVNQRAFLCILLNELRIHVDIYRRLQMSLARLATRSRPITSKHSIVSVYETFAILHPALQSKESEKGHLSQIMSSVITALFPRDLLGCVSLNILLQDFLTQNLFQTVVDLVSEPDFLNEALIILLSDVPLNPPGEPHDRCTATKHDGILEPVAENQHIDPSKMSVLRLREDLGSSNKGINTICEGNDIQKAAHTIGLASGHNDEKTKSSKGTMSGSNKCYPSEKENSDSTFKSKSSIPLTMIEPSNPITYGDSWEEVSTPQMNIAVPLTMLEPSEPVSHHHLQTVASTPVLVSESESREHNVGGKTEVQKLQAEELKLRCHRRSASTGSTIYTPPKSITTSAMTTMTATSTDVISGLQDDDVSFGLETNAETLRTCFSAECLTDLDDEKLALSQAMRRSPSTALSSQMEWQSGLTAASPGMTRCGAQFQPDIKSSVQEAISKTLAVEQEEEEGQAEDQPDAREDAELKTNLGEDDMTLQRHSTFPVDTVAGVPHPLPPSSLGAEIPLEWVSWRVRDLHIPTTSWMGDATGKRPIVYFVIKYTLFKKPTMSSESGTAFSHVQGMEVSRRYREFANLHSRISSNPLHRRHLKGVSNIPKQSMLPMTRVSPAVEETKKNLLESYLLQLLSRPMIHNSQEMAEFLAIDGDAHIEFVKKASSHIPRIDKLLMTQVSGFVGTIKTILPDLPARGSAPVPSRGSAPTHTPNPNPTPTPTLPTQPEPHPSLKRTQTLPSFPVTAPPSDHYVPAGKHPLMRKIDLRLHKPAQPSTDDGLDMDVSRVRLYGLDDATESRVQRAMQSLMAQRSEDVNQGREQQQPSLDGEKAPLGPRSAGDGSDEPDMPHAEGKVIDHPSTRRNNQEDVLWLGTEVAKTRGAEGVKCEGGGADRASLVDVSIFQGVYGVVSEALRGQQSFLLDESMQDALRILVGGLIDKWLEREVRLVFTEAQWGYYLSLLRELLWPDGTWNPKPRKTKTPQEMAQTKAEALHELTHNALATALSLFVGEDAVHKGFSLVLDSIQDKEINRHLILTILDHAMDQLVPEASDAEFQDQLAAMP